MSISRNALLLPLSVNLLGAVSSDFFFLQSFDAVGWAAGRASGL